MKEIKRARNRRDVELSAYEFAPDRLQLCGGHHLRQGVQSRTRKIELHGGDPVPHHRIQNFAERWTSKGFGEDAQLHGPGAV